MKIFKSSDLLQLKQSGVYCIRNTKEKYVQVFASRNIIYSLAKLLDNIDSGEYGLLRFHKADTEIEIIETGVDPIQLKVVLSGHIERYKASGYTMYKDTNLVCYKLVESVVILDGKGYYVVFLQNRRKDKIPVGVFDTKEESEVWSEATYPGGKITGILVCSNNNRYLLEKLK